MKALKLLKRNFSKIIRRILPAALVVALWGSSSSAAELPTSVKVDTAKLKRPEKRLVLEMTDSAQLSAEGKAIDLGHYSHYSHYSHVSHSSHVSHFSHYSHYSG